MRKSNTKKAGRQTTRKPAEYRAQAEPSTIAGLAATLSASARDMRFLERHGREEEARGAMRVLVAGAIELGSIPARTLEEAHLKEALLGAIALPDLPGGRVINAAAMFAAALRHERERWRLPASDGQRH